MKKRGKLHLLHLVESSLNPSQTMEFGIESIPPSASFQFPLHHAPPPKAASDPATISPEIPTLIRNPADN